MSATRAVSTAPAASLQADTGTRAEAVESAATARPRPSRITLAALAAPSLPLVALTLPLNVYLPEHYGNALGLNLGTVGLIFMLVRLVDIAFDPFIGGVMDRTRTRWGRFKPWLALSAPIIVLGVAMLFLARPGVGPLYLTVWLAVVYAGFSIATLSQLALAAGLSGDYNERSRVYAWWQGGNTLGAVVVLLFPTMWTRLTGDGGHEVVPLMGWSIIMATPLAFAFCLWRLREGRESGARPSAGPHEYFALLRRRSIRIILTVDLLMGIGAGVSSASMIFFVTLSKGLDRNDVSLLLITHLGVATCSGAVWSSLARRIQKHRALVVSSLAHALAMTLALLAPAGNLAFMLCAMVVGGLAYGGNTILPRAMIADAGDEERLETGVDRTGMLYAWITSVYKIGTALAVGAVFVILERVGFSPAAGAHNPPGALAAIAVLYAGVGALMPIISAGLIVYYPLTAARHVAIRAALDRRDAAGAGPTSDPTISVETSRP